MKTSPGDERVLDVADNHERVLDVADKVVEPGS